MYSVLLISYLLVHTFSYIHTVACIPCTHNGPVPGVKVRVAIILSRFVTQNASKPYDLARFIGSLHNLRQTFKVLKSLQLSGVVA